MKIDTKVYANGVEIAGVTGVEVVYDTTPILTTDEYPTEPAPTLTYWMTAQYDIRAVARAFGIPIKLLRRRTVHYETPTRTALHTAYDRRRRARARRRRNS